MTSLDLPLLMAIGLLQLWFFTGPQFALWVLGLTLEN
jgi:hypothetical protein